MVVLDNSATVTSGFQPNPGSGRDARGARARRLGIEAVAKACGVEFLRTIGPEGGEAEVRAALREALGWKGIGLVVLRRPCAGDKAAAP